MAVEVVKRMITCYNCGEELRYSRGDCEIKEVKEPVPESNHHPNGDYYTILYRMMGTYDYWYITCPTCGKVLDVNHVLRKKVPLAHPYYGVKRKVDLKLTQKTD